MMITMLIDDDENGCSFLLEFVMQLQRQEGGVTREGKQRFVRFQYDNTAFLPEKTAIAIDIIPDTKVPEGEDKFDGGNGTLEEKDAGTAALEEAAAAAPVASAGESAKVPSKQGDRSNTSNIDKMMLDTEAYQYLDQQCSICLCEYEQGEDLCMLPCHHAFHDDCITVWVTNHSKCPLCLRDLNTLVPTTPAIPPHPVARRASRELESRQ